MTDPIRARLDELDVDTPAGDECELVAIYDGALRAVLELCEDPGRRYVGWVPFRDDIRRVIAERLGTNP